MENIGVLVVDDRPLMLAAMVHMLDQQPGVAVVGGAADIATVPALILQLRPDVVIISSLVIFREASIPLSSVSRDSPQPRILVMSVLGKQQYHYLTHESSAGMVLEQSSNDEFISALDLAARDYVLLPPTELRDQGTACPASSTQKSLALLTKREFDVFELLSSGLDNSQISRRLSISLNTVKSHVRSILAKLSLRNRVEVVRYAYGVRLVSSHPLMAKDRQ
jgi:DNA-binding NarL/FixJ family response regulator